MVGTFCKVERVQPGRQRSKEIIKYVNLVRAISLLADCEGEKVIGIAQLLP